MATQSSVSSLGVGSGLDLQSLLTNLVAAEKQPITLLQTQQSSYKTKISAYGNISSKLSTLQNAANALKSPTSLESYKASSTDTTVASATTGVGSAAGTYALHVNSLAKAHTLNSAAFADPTAAIGTGTMRVTVGSSSFDLTIDSSNNSLNGIRDAINASASNTGVQATVIQDVNGARLALTSKNTGSTNAISVAISETGTPDFTSPTSDPANRDNTGLSKLAYVTGAATNLTEAQAAANASLTVNGISINSASNTLTTAISGVTVNLTKAGDTTLTIDRDIEGITKLVTNYINAFNDFQTTTRTASSYDSASKTGQVLNGESATRSILSTITRTVQQAPASATGTYNNLASLGITLNKDGTLAVDSKKLQTAISTDFTSVKSVLSGYATATAAAAADLTSTSGTLTNRVNGLNSSFKMTGTRIDQMNLRLAAFEKRYRDQFVALDTTVSQMNATSSYLTQQLAKLA